MCSDSSFYNVWALALSLNTRMVKLYPALCTSEGLSPSSLKHFGSVFNLLELWTADSYVKMFHYDNTAGVHRGHFIFFWHLIPPSGVFTNLISQNVFRLRQITGHEPNFIFAAHQSVRKPFTRHKCDPNMWGYSEPTHWDLNWNLTCCVNLQVIHLQFVVAAFNSFCVLIQTRACGSLARYQHSISESVCVYMCASIRQCWHVSSWVYPSDWPLSAQCYRSALFVSFLPQSHALIHSHTVCIYGVIPLGMALSVAMVPLTAFSRSLVLSLPALTRPFSQVTLSASSAITHIQTQK